MAKGGFSTAMDTARVGACFMVVMLHVAAVNFSAFDEQWWASNFYDSLTRSCVPVFLMISGVLLLSKQETLPAFFRKRFVRVIPPLLFWSLFYMGWNTWQGRDYGSVANWFGHMASGPVVFHLWYLYAIVGIYLFVPVLRNIWNASQPGEKRAYLLMWAAVSMWPTVQGLFGLEADILETYGLGSFFGLVGYLFLGAYAHELYRQQPAKRQYFVLNAFLFVLFSVLTMVATFLHSRAAGAPNTLFYDYLSPFVLASSLCAFNVLYAVGTKVGDFAGPLKEISACTLGVYCIHIFVMDRIEASTRLLDAGASQWWAIPVMAACVFVISLITIMALRRFRPFEWVT